MRFWNFQRVAVVGEEVVFLGDFGDLELAAFGIGNVVALLEADADERGGVQSVEAGLLGGREVDFDAVELGGEHDAQSEGWL